MITQPKPRGRPRAFDRDAALEAAMIVFWQKGYSAASMSDLCTAMGIGSPSLYAAFGSKENLYAEAIAHYGERGCSQIHEILDSAPTARIAVEAFLKWAAAILTAPGKPSGCMVVLSSIDSEALPELGKIVCSERQNVVELIQNRLQRGIGEGDISPATDIAALTRFYVTLHQGMSIQARDGATREDLQTIASTAMAAWPTSAN